MLRVSLPCVFLWVEVGMPTVRAEGREEILVHISQQYLLRNGD